MSEKLTIRRLLACLNISVFDSHLLPFLKHQSHRFAHFQPQALFFLFLLSVGMWTGTLAFYKTISLFLLQQQQCPDCFSYPVVLTGTGFCTLVCALSVYGLLENALMQRGIWMYVLGGELLLLEGVFSLCPFMSPLIAFILFFFIGQDEKNTFCQTTTVLLYCLFLTKFLFEKSGIYAPVYTVLFSAPFGWFEALFPRRHVRWERASSILLVFPLVVLAGTKFLQLNHMNEKWETTGIDLIFLFLMILTAFCLRKEMSRKEKRNCIKSAVFLFLVSFVLPEGLIASVSVLFASYLIDSLLIFLCGTGFFFLFLLVAILKTGLSFLQAGMICCLISFILSFYFRKIRRRSVNP